MKSKKHTVVSSEPMSLEESFHNCYFYFMDAVGVLALSAVEQCEIMDNLNVAWEIQHDVLDAGISLIDWPIDYLSQSEKDAIARIAMLLKELPEEALLSDHTRAMNHPSWTELRLAATHLMTQLDGATKRNREFFDIQRPQG
jgi:hypothetical protein